MGRERAEEPRATLPAALERILTERPIPRSAARQAFPLVACDRAGRLRMALLSIGEVRVLRGSADILLAVYDGSRTTSALLENGRGLLAVVADGALFKLTLAVRGVSVLPEEIGGVARSLRLLRASVVDVSEDRVPYATLRTGMSFELHQPDIVLDQWAQQWRAMEEAELGPYG